LALEQGGVVELTFNDLFMKQSKTKDNNQLATEALNILLLRELVVARLSSFEATDIDTFWWNDKELMSFIKELFMAGIVFLPNDPVERLRWIALLCIECSKMEEFDCGSILLPIDFVSTYDLEKYVDLYGVAVIGDVIQIRELLKEMGWDAVFGW
jgi:hypothetical protein